MKSKKMIRVLVIEGEGSKVDQLMASRITDSRAVRVDLFGVKVIETFWGTEEAVLKFEQPTLEELLDTSDLDTPLDELIGDEDNFKF